MNQLLESKHNWSFIGKYKQLQNKKICKIDYASLLTYCKVYIIPQLLRTAQNCTLIGKSKKLLNYWKVHKIALLLENITKLLT